MTLPCSTLSTATTLVSIKALRKPCHVSKTCHLVHLEVYIRVLAVTLSSPEKQHDIHTASQLSELHIMPTGLQWVQCCMFCFVRASSRFTAEVFWRYFSQYTVYRRLATVKNVPLCSAVCDNKALSHASDYSSLSGQIYLTAVQILNRNM